MVVRHCVCAWAGQYLLALFIPNLMMEALYAIGQQTVPTI